MEVVKSAGRGRTVTRVEFWRRNFRADRIIAREQQLSDANDNFDAQTISRSE